MSAVEARLAALEARVAELEAGGGKSRTPHSGDPEDVMSPDMLTNAWADKSVRKLPSNWAGRDIVGMNYSELTAKECRALAGFYEFKARKGREEVPVRLSNRKDRQGNPVPWHESDSFEAKILRTWSKQKEENPDRRYGTSGHGASTKHTGSPEPDAFAVGPGADVDDGGIPFALPLDVTPRHLRRRTRWEKW